MSPYVDLLRHGHTDGGARYCGTTDVPLNSTGWEQMWAAVNRDMVWAAIHCSPLARCSDFARALAQRRSLPVYVDERLREMDFGVWEGRTAAEIQQTDPVALAGFWQNPWHNAPPRGEPLADLQARVLSAWRDIVAHHRPALIISHGGPLRMILAHLSAHPPERLLDIDVPHASLFRVPLTASGQTLATSRP